VADTFAGRIHLEWDGGAPVTPLGQLPFFIEYVKQGGLFDGVVADCPLHYTSPNAPRKRDVLGTVLLSVLHPATSIPPSIPRPACGSSWMACRPSSGRG
jgi:hypothetical protein